MIYKYSLYHKYPLLHCLKFKLADVYHNRGSGFVAPISSSITAGFVAGCGHSGTTLVAAKLGNHPNVHLIPRESNVFSPSRGLAGAKAVVEEWLKDAERKGKTCFIEKTPKHIHAVFRIRKILPGARFIILTRNPIDNCASLFKRFKDLDYAVERWNIDNRELPKISRLPRVLIMKYEEISIDPGPAFERMCGFLGLPWIPDILEARPTGYDREVFSDENMLLRREQVRRAVATNVGKGKDDLSEPQYQYVREKTKALAEKVGYAGY